MPVCCVPFCRSSSMKEKISFHQIPSNTDRRILWLEAISRKDKYDSPWIPNQYDTVCQKHFTPNDYTKGAKRMILKKNSIPSIFKNHPKAKNKQPKVKQAMCSSDKTDNVPVSPSNKLDQFENNMDLSLENNTSSSISTLILNPSGLKLETEILTLKPDGPSNEPHQLENKIDLSLDNNISSSTCELALNPSDIKLETEILILKQDGPSNEPGQWENNIDLSSDNNTSSSTCELALNPSDIKLETEILTLKLGGHSNEPDQLENNIDLPLDNNTSSTSAVALNPPVIKLETENLTFKKHGPDQLENSIDLSFDNNTSYSTSVTTLDPPVIKLETENLSLNKHGPDQLENNIGMSLDNDTFSSTFALSLDPSVRRLQTENFLLKNRIRTLKSNLYRERQKIKKVTVQNRSLLKEKENLIKKITEFGNIEKDASEGSKQAIFLLDQIKSRQKLLNRWSPEVVQLCIPWYRHSPSGYNYVRKSKFLSLPSRTTLKKCLKMH